MDMNLQKYMAFVKTVDAGSFTKAAELLNYSQSGISRMIGDLEKEWGVSLLERGKSGVKLTGDGMKLLPYARNLCAEFEKLEMQIDELNGLQSGFIRIGTVSSMATHWLPKIIKEFQRDYPNMDYELLSGDYTEIEEWIRTGRVDCGFIRIHDELDFDVVFKEKDRMLVVIPEDHPLKDCERFPFSALYKEPFMLLHQGEKSEVSEILEKHNLTPDIKIRTWDDYSIMSMVENGLGIGILPELIMKRASYRIVAKELEVPEYREIGLVMRDKNNSSLAMKRFIEYLEYRNK